jgi:hypothetical protein
MLKTNVVLEHFYQLGSKGSIFAQTPPILLLINYPRLVSFQMGNLFLQELSPNLPSALNIIDFYIN